MVNDLRQNWLELSNKLSQQFKVEVDIVFVLFLIGIQETGKGFENFTREQKFELIYIGNCKALSYMGYYKQIGVSSEQWPIWKNLKPLPELDEYSKEQLLKEGIISYFKEQNYLI